MESNHGLSEVISYFIRLVINCVILIHVVPLALKWRKEKKILRQLESLASRLQLTAVTPSPNYGGNYGNTIPRSSKDVEIEACRQENGVEKVVGGLDNPAYLQSYPYLHYGSQNEFDASIFGMNPSQYIGPPPPNNMGKNIFYHLLSFESLIGISSDFSKTNSVVAWSSILSNNDNEDSAKDERQEWQHFTQQLRHANAK